jgi:Uncharacterized protein YfbK, C-terminal/von Willebrand factor
MKKDENKLKLFQDLLTETRIPLSLGKFFILSVIMHIVMIFIFVNLDLNPPELPTRNYKSKNKPTGSTSSVIKEEERYSGFSGPGRGDGGSGRGFSGNRGSNEVVDLTDRVATSEVVYKHKVTETSLDNSGDQQIHLYDKPFLDAGKQPSSNFPLTQRETASFDKLKEYIEHEQVPPEQLIKIEEMINYFNYEYPLPGEKELFTITTELSDCPWEESHLLLNIGLQAKIVEADETLKQRDFVIARNLEMNVTFNGEIVNAYRLIGHGNRKPVPGEIVEKETMGNNLRMGQTMTTLYQLIPNEKTIALYKGNQGEKEKEPQLATIHVSYYDPEKSDTELQEKILPVRHPLNKEEAASDDFLFSAAVAQFAMILKSSSIKDMAAFARLMEMARDAIGEDRNGYRKEFIELLIKYKNIKSED